MRLQGISGRLLALSGINGRMQALFSDRPPQSWGPAGSGLQTKQRIDAPCGRCDAAPPRAVAARGIVDVDSVMPSKPYMVQSGAEPHLIAARQIEGREGRNLRYRRRSCGHHVVT